MVSLLRRPARAGRIKQLDRRYHGENDDRSPCAPPSSDISDGAPSLDIIQKLEKKLAELNASENVFKRWIYELVTWSISALCLGFIVFILFRVNKRTLSKHSVEISAYTVLSKIASAALLLPISEALGQLKWNWFHGEKSKEIWDFEIFDKASRGAWGSILLLFRTKGRFLAALGAMLTILLIANDTFFQQVIDLPQRWSLQGKGQLARGVFYDPPTMLQYRNNLELAGQDDFMKTAKSYFYMNGTYPITVAEGVRPDIPISCPTSNCTFPSYKTLGVCSKCEDVTRLLTFACKNTTVDWINNKTVGSDHTGQMCGYFFNASDAAPLMMSGYLQTDIHLPGTWADAGEALILRLLPMVATPDRIPLWNGSLRFKNIRNPITDVIVTAAVNGVSGTYRNETPVATECMLSWCVKEIESSYAYGGYREKIIRTFTNSTAGPYPWNTAKVVGFFNGTDVTYKENVTIVVPDEELTFGASNVTHNRVVPVFDDMFPSFLTASKTSPTPVLRATAYATGAPYTRRIPMVQWMPPNNISEYFERMATAMTDTLRSTQSHEMVDGPAYTIETFILVKWEWLTFPIILLVLSLVFLVATILKTKNAKDQAGPDVWKTSAMPALIYSLPTETQKQFNSPQSSKGTGEGKKLRVKLHPEKGWRVSGQVYSPTTPVIVCRTNQPPPGWI